MKPVDPRLLRESRPARRWIGVVVVAGLISAVLTIAAALVLSHVLAGAVQGHATLSKVAVPLLAVAGLATGRGLVMWLAEYAGHLGARRVIASLRARLLRTLAGNGPALLQDQRTGAIVTAATSGLESLDVYFARYLPQLVLGATVPTLALLVLALNDTLTALIVLITLPLIPLFMWLIGAAAQHQMNRRWLLLQRLGAYFLDVIQGLPTLRIFSRADTQIERVLAITEAARRATMGTLSIAFLSALVLESLASIATALVAAEIGLRLVDGTMTLQTGLAVLIIVPEAYLPLRQLGTFFHSSMQGVSAAATILDLTDEDSGAHRVGAGPRVQVPLAASTVTFSEVTCLYGERDEGLGTPLTCSFLPRTTTLITGASGAGKSTLLGLLIPFRQPTSGTIRIGGIDLTNLDLDHWRSQVGWVPQHPSLFPGSVLDNLRIGAPGVTEVEAQAMLTRLFPDGSLHLHSTLTSDGDGISGGERVRIALARALLRSPGLLVLDEPTAFLDPDSVSAAVSLLAEAAATTTLVIATHEPQRFPWAQQIVDLDLTGSEAEVERVG